MRFVVEHRYETVVHTTEGTRRRERDATTIQYSCDNTIKNVSRPKVKYTYVRPVTLIFRITVGKPLLYVSRITFNQITNSVDWLPLQFSDRTDDVCVLYLKIILVGKQFRYKARACFPSLFFFFFFEKRESANNNIVSPQRSDIHLCATLATRKNSYVARYIVNTRYTDFLCQIACDRACGNFFTGIRKRRDGGEI